MRAYFMISSLLLVAMFWGCKSSKEKSKAEICYDNTFSHPIEKVSLKDVEKIKQLDGKFVEIEGIFRFAFEDVAIYPTKKADISKAMWVTIKSDIATDKVLDQLDNRQVIIIGRINLKRKGHFGAYIGTLDNISCIKKK